MDFQTLAATETSTLVERLLAKQASGPAQQLQALREALDAAAQALAAPVRVEQEVQELAARLTQTADAEIQRVRQDAGNEVQRARQDADGEVQRARQDANAAVEAARREAMAAAGDAEQLRAAIVQSEAEAALLKSELQTAQDRADAAERDLGLTIEAHATVEAALHQAEDDARHTEQARAAIDAQLQDARTAIERMIVETADLRARCERNAAEKTAFETELARARATGDERDAIATELAAARSRVHALEAELTAAGTTRAERDSLAGEREAALARIGGLEQELSARTAQVQTLERDLAATRDVYAERDLLAEEFQAASVKLTELEAQLAEIRGARDQRDAAVRELELSQERIQALETARQEREEQLRDLRTRLEQAQSEVTRLEARAIPPREAAPSGSDEADRLRDEVERMVSLFDASARAVTEMAAANSSSELLTELVKRLSLQFSRVAMFRLKGNRLEGEQQIGFEDITDISKVVIPTSVDSLLTRAIACGTVQSLAGDDVAVRSGTPFGGTPMSAVALPIVLQGTTLAVVYADDSDMPDTARGPAIHESSVGYARLLVGQVVVLLVRHTHELKTLAELSQYATTLLQEAKEMYLADAQAGKNPDLLRSRLKANIDCASQLYTYRAAMEGTAAASLLDDQIAVELEESSPFARDLAAVLQDMAAADVHLTAEAS